MTPLLLALLSLLPLPVPDAEPRRVELAAVDPPLEHGVHRTLPHRRAGDRVGAVRVSVLRAGNEISLWGCVKSQFHKPGVCS